jgi:hypothetical protein
LRADAQGFTVVCMTKAQRKAALAKLNELNNARRAAGSDEQWTKLNGEWQALFDAIHAGDRAPQVASEFR